MNLYSHQIEHKQIRKEHYIDYVSLIVLLIAVLLFVFFPFRNCKVKYELEKLFMRSMER